MKKLNPVYFVMTVMLLAGIFLVGRSFYRIYNRKPLVVEKPEESLAQKQLAEVRSQDMGVLDAAAEKPPGEVAKSLRRLQRQSSADAPKYIAQFINSENAVIRAAALEAAAALGLNEFEKQILGGLASDDTNIRIAVLKGLGQRPNDFSRATVKAHWGRDVKNSKERFVALLTLQRVEQGEDKRQWQTQLVRELRAYKGKEHPVEWVDAFKSLPANDELLEGAWNIVRNAQASEVSFRALLYLRDFAGPQALKSGLGSVNVPDHRRFQLALIDMIFDYCPTGWSDIVKRISGSSPHPMVKKGLEEAELSVKCL